MAGSKMLAVSVLLFIVDALSWPCFGFVAPLASTHTMTSRPSSRSSTGIGAVHDPNVVVAGNPKPVLSGRGVAGAQRRSSLVHSAAVAGGISMSVATAAPAEGELKQWAENKFPGCSTVVSSATRLSGLLAEVWETLADPAAVVDASSPRVLLFPECESVAEARGLQGLYEHLEVCQDACDSFGTAVSIVPHPKGGNSGAPAAALVVQVVPGAGGGDEFGYDPDWDDDWEIDRSLLGDDDEDGGEGGLGEGEFDIAALNVVPGSDDEVTELTKAWVQAVITDMGVCPFSVDASRAGLPVGQVRYPVTRETTAEAVYREYWQEVELLVSEKDEKSLSTTLLITPEFALNNAEAFEVIGQTLTQPLEALHLEDDIQLVFFHPQYTFRDGRDRLGSAGAANFARRSPFPMINILRTSQVRLGQRSIPTGLVYKQNEEVLEEVGAGSLQKMLETRDWAGLEGKKVDRRRVDYYETARKLQGLGVEAPKAPVDDATAESKTSTGDARSKVLSPSEIMGARESLTAAAGQMGVQFGGGTDEEGGEEDDGDSGGGAAQELARSKATNPVAPGGQALPRAASSSKGITKDDLRLVATAIVKRLGNGLPLKPAAFEEFDAAVGRMLTATDAT